MLLTGWDSDDSDTDTVSDDTDRDAPVRGRRTSFKVLLSDGQETIRRKRQYHSPSQGPASVSYRAEPEPRGTSPHQLTFTRSRSPYVNGSRNGAGPQSSGNTPFVRHKPLPTFYSLMPVAATANVRIPLSSISLTFYATSRSLAESILLLFSLFMANRQLAHALKLVDPSISSISLGKRCLIYTASRTNTASPVTDVLLFIFIAYLLWAHTSLSKVTNSIPILHEKDDGRSISPRIDARENKKNGGTGTTPTKPHFGFVWMSVPKNFR